MTNEPEPNTRHLPQPSECELCNGLNTCCPDGCDLNAPQPSELVEGYDPCPTCRQYSHSIGCDVVAVAFNHFQSMIAHPVRGHPMGDTFDEQTRDAAQVLMAQLAKLQAELVECDTREAGLVADLSADALAREKLQADGDKLAWQPIETAPKNGAHILACDQRDTFGWLDGAALPVRQTVVHWFPDQDEPGFYTSINEIEPQRPFKATHWKPLDSPPKH